MTLRHNSTSLLDKDIVKANRNSFSLLSRIAVILALALARPGLSRAAAPDDFARDCASCHTIGGGRLTGPDLKDVAKRRSPDWLGKFIADPKKMLESGDPTAVELYKSYNNVLMPTISGLTPARISELLGLIDEESKLEQSRFAGLSLINRPLTPGDVADGEALFLGRRALKNGAASCVSCHSVGGMAWLGGGFLGPDLTSAFSRLGGEKGLASWLVSPVSPTMQPVYSGRALDPAEILSLTAYLKDAAGRGRPADSIARLAFLIIGIIGAAALFAVLDSAWSGRLQSVRRALVAKTTSSEAHDG